MTLNAILEALAINAALTVKIVKIEEETEVELISFMVPGYEELNTELLAMTVKEMRLGSSMSLEQAMTILVE